MIPQCVPTTPETPPSPFAILTTVRMLNGYVAIEASDSWGDIVSCVLPYRSTTWAGMQAGLLQSWRLTRAARADRCAALVSWENEGAPEDAMAS